MCKSPPFCAFRLTVGKLVADRLIAVSSLLIEDGAAMDDVAFGARDQSVTGTSTRRAGGRLQPLLQPLSEQLLYTVCSLTVSFFLLLFSAADETIFRIVHFSLLATVSVSWSSLDKYRGGGRWWITRLRIVSSSSSRRRRRRWSRCCCLSLSLLRNFSRGCFG